VGIPRRTLTVVLETAAVLTAAVAVTYLVVACQSLPSVLGPVAGDPHPRTRLGEALLIVAVLLAGGGLGLRRRQQGHG
jgi:hypothetical protein